MTDLRDVLYKKEIDSLGELVGEPLWYKKFGRLRTSRLMGAAAIGHLSGSEVGYVRRVRDSLYEAFVELLADNIVSLGEEGYNWDATRCPVDTIVLHHTGRSPGLRTEFLNAMHLIRLYVPVYASASLDKNSEIMGQPIYSHHFTADKQVFWAYHWLVRSDGDVERLLTDDQTGWQAGSWDVNCRSIAICIDDDLTNNTPNGDVLASIAEVIRTHYAHVDISPTSLLGHREVNLATICPGKQFMGGWKLELLDRLAI